MNELGKRLHPLIKVKCLQEFSGTCCENIWIVFNLFWGHDTYWLIGTPEKLHNLLFDILWIHFGNIRDHFFFHLWFHDFSGNFPLSSLSLNSLLSCSVIFCLFTHRVVRLQKSVSKPFISDRGLKQIHLCLFKLVVFVFTTLLQQKLLDVMVLILSENLIIVIGSRCFRV